ncbi:FAD:protein FMN transferase [bacterium]|nr:FAD:protein FMN transferase [bacterium]
MAIREPFNLKLPDIERLNSVQRFDHAAMNTQFEIWTVHPNAYYARQAAHEAFVLLDQIEHDLSRYISNSDISRINQLPGHPVIISEQTLRCLQQCQHAEKLTSGYFNAIVGHLTGRSRGNTRRGTGEIPSSASVLEIDAEHYLVTLNHEQAQIDLGGIGKGYAVDRMVDLMHDWEIGSALIHGGRSTVYAYGQFQDEIGWPVSISDPFTRKAEKRIRLNNRALSASGLSRGMHIINVKSGKPVQANQAAWAMAPTAALSDALSTGLMAMPLREIGRMCEMNQGCAGLKIMRKNAMSRLYAYGIFN